MFIVGNFEVYLCYTVTPGAHNSACVVKMKACVVKNCYFT